MESSSTTASVADSSAGVVSADAAGSSGEWGDGRRYRYFDAFNFVRRLVPVGHFHSLGIERQEVALAPPITDELVFTFPVAQKIPQPPDAPPEIVRGHRNAIDLVHQLVGRNHFSGTGG
jgi:hypothetical protein